MSKPSITIIESPFSGDVARNRIYAQRALLDSISHLECPFASHLLYTQILDDTHPRQREVGIQLGFHFFRHAKQVAVYQDYGISPGMARGIDYANRRDIPVIYRRIGPNPDPAASTIEENDTPAEESA